MAELSTVFQATFKVANPRRRSAARVKTGSAFRCARTACWESQWGGHSPRWLAASGEDTTLPILKRPSQRQNWSGQKQFLFPGASGAVPDGEYGRTEAKAEMLATLRDPEGAWLPLHRGLRPDALLP